MAAFVDAVELQTRAASTQNWRVVAVAALGLFLSMGTIVVLSFGVYLKPLTVDFHASRSTISLAFTIQSLATALCVPLLGRLIDRFGARVVVIIGTALFGIALVGSLLVRGEVGGLYLFFATLGIIGSATSPVPYGVIVSRWFDRRRGLALGFMAAGLGLGAIVVPFVSQRLIASIGWRESYAVLGLATLAIVLPMAMWFLKQSPSQNAAILDRTSHAPAVEAEGLTWGEVLRTPVFWCMIGAYFLAALSLFGCIVHLPSMMSDRGSTAGNAAIISSVTGVALLAGRFGSGFFLDRVFAPKLAMMVFGGAAVAIGILLVASAGLLIYVAAFLLGLAMGAEVDIIAYMMSRYFGLRALGTAFATGFASYVIAGAVGVELMGAGFDVTHAYTLPLTGCAATMLLAIVLIGRLGPYRYHPSST